MMLLKKEHLINTERKVKTMKKNILKKECKTTDGRTYDKYFTLLTSPDGEEIITEVKFRRPTQPPATYPATIVFDTSEANLAKKAYDGKIYYTLWITKYTEEVYEDTSLEGWS